MRRFTFIFAGAVVFASTMLVEACAASGGSEEGTDGDAAAGGDAAQTIDGSPVGTDSETPDSNEVTDTGAFDAGCVLTPPSNKCAAFFRTVRLRPGTTLLRSDSGEAILPTAGTPSVGAAAANASCAVSTDCQEGLTCLFDRCHEFCGNAGDPCSAPFSTCHNHASTTGYNVCGIKCDLSSSSSCGSLGCVGVSDGTGATSECEPVGSGTNGMLLARAHSAARRASTASATRHADRRAISHLPSARRGRAMTSLHPSSSTESCDGATATDPKITARGQAGFSPERLRRSDFPAGSPGRKLLSASFDLAEADARVAGRRAVSRR